MSEATAQLQAVVAAYPHVIAQIDMFNSSQLLEEFGDSCTALVHAREVHFMTRSIFVASTVSPGK